MPQQRTRDDDAQPPDASGRLRERAERAERERERLQHENERLRREIERVKRQLDEARRAAHRQAAPFAKALAPNPRRPGRKAGARYGVKAHRRRPRGIDERHEAPVPCACPHCGGPVRETRVTTQYQEELPVAIGNIRGVCKLT